MKLAAAAELPAAGVETRSIDGIDYLLVERHDRTHRQPGGGAPVLRPVAPGGFLSGPRHRL